MWRDGMHLSQAGHAAVAEEVARQVQRVLGRAVDGGGQVQRALGRAEDGDPTCLGCLVRLLCCRAESWTLGARWTALEQHGP